MLLLHRYDDALAIFDRCVGMAPEVAQYHNDRGRALASLERYQESIDAFDKALSIDRKDGQIWKYKGLALLKLGQASNALACFNGAIDRGMEDSVVWASKGRAMEELNRPQDALECYQKALSIDDKDASIWARLGSVYAKQGNLEAAADAIDRSLKIDPQNKKGWIARAALMEKLEKDEEALKSYDSAIGLDPTDAFAWNSKGMVLLRIGSADQARRCFDKALSLNPELESAQEGIRISGDRQRREEVAQYAAKVLEAEARKGTEISKEDAFRECDIPYSHLDEVFAFLEEKEVVNLEGMSPKEKEEYEDASRIVLLAAYRNPGVAEHGLRLPDVAANLHGSDVIGAKKVLAYIEKVNELKFTADKPDAETEKQLRKVMNMPEEQRSAVGIMQHLGVGIYQSRKLMAYADTFRGGRKGYKAPKVKVKELHEETPEAVLGEVPSEDLVERATHKAESEAEEEPRPKKRQPTPYEAPDLYSRFYKEENRAEERTKVTEGPQGPALPVPRRHRGDEVLLLRLGAVQGMHRLWRLPQMQGGPGSAGGPPEEASRHRGKAEG
jgi:tetratricopeptide (TPR) repeat protein